MLAWWAPTLTLAVATLGLFVLRSAVVLVAGRLRFAAVRALGRALVAAGWPGAASRVYAREIRRAERGMRATEERRGW